MDRVPIKKSTLVVAAVIAVCVCFTPVSWANTASEHPAQGAGGAQGAQQNTANGSQPSFYIQGASRNENDENIVAFTVHGSFELNDVLSIYTNDSFIKSKAINQAENVGVKKVIIDNISLDSFFRGANSVVVKLERKGSVVGETAPFPVTIESPLEKPSVSVSPDPERDNVYTVTVTGEFQPNDAVILRLNGSVFRTEEITPEDGSRTTAVFADISRDEFIVGENVFQANIRRGDKESNLSDKTEPIILKAETPAEPEAESEPEPPVNQCLSFSEVPKKILNRDVGKYGYFGSDVAVRGATVLAGSGKNRAFIYESLSDIWSNTGAFSDSQFVKSTSQEVSVALHSETEAVVGMPYAGYRGHQSGAVFVYRKRGDVWTKAVSIIPGSLKVFESFGSSVVVDDGFLAVSADKRDNSGSVYLYTREGNQWVSPVLFVPSDSHENQRFGESISVDSERGVVAIGAPGDFQEEDQAGAVYVYTKSDDNLWSERKLTRTGADDGEQFGSAVFVDGDTLYIGVPRYSTGFGTVYVYDRSGPNWNFRTSLSPRQTDDTEDRKRVRERDLFGSSLTGDDQRLFIGAPGHVVSRDKVGAVYMYTTTNGIIALEKVVVPKETSEDEKFGSSVDFDGMTLIVGARSDSTAGRGSGAIHIVSGTYGSCTEPKDAPITKPAEPLAPAQSVSVASLNEKRNALQELAEKINALLQKSIQQVQNEVVRRQERVVVFDEESVTVSAQQRAAEQRGITGPAIPGEVVVKKINADGKEPKEGKKEIRSRDEVVDETRKDAGVVVPTETGSFKVGDSDEEIYRLQVFLNENGYIIARSGPGSPGNETSEFGPATERALKSFQLVNGIPVTGMLDEETRKVILTYVVDF